MVTDSSGRVTTIAGSHTLRRRAAGGGGSGGRGVHQPSVPVTATGAHRGAGRGGGGPAGGRVLHEPSVTVTATGHHRVARRRRCGATGAVAAGSFTAVSSRVSGPASSARAVAAAVAGAVTGGRVTAASCGAAAAVVPALSLAGWSPGRSRRKTRARGTARAMMTAPTRNAWV